jgi:hypothetical protein
MQKFDATKFIEVSNRLGQLHQQLVVGQWVAFPPTEYESLRCAVTEFRQQLGDLELDAAEISAGRLLEVLDKGQPGQHEGIDVVMYSVWDTGLIRDSTGETVTRARDQLKSRLLLEIPLRARDLYIQPIPLFGQDTARNFPSVAYEIEEAGKCLALDRSTASAFHSIRCLEAGIRAV